MSETCVTAFQANVVNASLIPPLPGRARRGGDAFSTARIRPSLSRLVNALGSTLAVKKQAEQSLHWMLSKKGTEMDNLAAIFDWAERLA